VHTFVLFSKTTIDIYFFKLYNRFTNGKGENKKCIKLINLDYIQPKNKKHY